MPKKGINNLRPLPEVTVQPPEGQVGTQPQRSEDRLGRALQGPTGFPVKPGMTGRGTIRPPETVSAISGLVWKVLIVN
ncbi:MAG: hypothetical protein IK145_05155 [Bacteroidales bacterium]|nr:hypothetical protein [Bacteroidales bacterium]